MDGSAGGRRVSLRQLSLAAGINTCPQRGGVCLLPAGSEPGPGGAACRAGVEQRGNRRTNGAAALLSLSTHVALASTRDHPPLLSLHHLPLLFSPASDSGIGVSYVRDLPDLHNSLFFHPPSFAFSPPTQRLQLGTNNTAQTNVEQQPPSVPTPSVGASGGKGSRGEGGSGRAGTPGAPAGSGPLLGQRSCHLQQTAGAG